MTVFFHLLLILEQGLSYREEKRADIVFNLLFFLLNLDVEN